MAGRSGQLGSDLVGRVREEVCAGVGRNRFAGLLESRRRSAGQASDGDFRLAGRADDMIISGASNIHPEEVEAVLGKHPGITDVAVVGVPDGCYGNLVVACAVGNGASAADLDEHCRTSDLADFKRPQAYLFLPGLPRNSLAKVLRSELRSTAAGAHHDGRLTYISPASPPPPGHNPPATPQAAVALPGGHD